MSTEKPVDFPLLLRIPSWCNRATVTVNGHKQDGALKAGTFVILNRTFQNDDKIVLHLPMELKLSRWGQEDKGAAIERGPLVYARPIKARELKYLHVTGQDTADFPSYFLYPTSTWNYAIGVNEENIETTVKVIANKEFAAGYGWDLATTPVRLQVLCAKSPTGHSIPTRPMAAIKT